MRRDSIFTYFCTYLVISVVLTMLLGGAFGVVLEAVGQVRSSANYQLQSDSVNVGGGDSASASYRQESTVGEVATGRSTSTSYQLQAGYQQMQEVFIGITIASTSVSMRPALPGRGGAATSTGTTSVTVVTDSSGGYELTIAASDAPAMKSAVGTIADYTAGATPDFTFSLGATDAHFGFTPEGADVIGRFLDNGSACGTGSGEQPGRCWDGLAMTAAPIARGSGANHPSGATTTLRFQVGRGADVTLISGDYVATTTVTALPL